jgi:hypothetical protein
MCFLGYMGLAGNRNQSMFLPLSEGDEGKPCRTSAVAQTNRDAYPDDLVKRKCLSGFLQLGLNPFLGLLRGQVEDGDDLI